MSSNQAKNDKLQKNFSEIIDVKLDEVKQEIDKSCSTLRAEVKPVVGEFGQEIKEQRVEIVDLKVSIRARKTNKTIVRGIFKEK